jgi:hypothetical protein
MTPVHRPQVPVYLSVGARAKAPPIQPERLRYLAGRIHALGPRSLYELFRELDNGADLHERFERYSELAPLTNFIRDRGADRLPAARLFQGGRDDGWTLHRRPAGAQ